MHESPSQTNAHLSPATASPANEPVTVPIPTCPRCGGKLTDPGGIEWCPACGHSELLQQQAQQLPDPPRRRTPSNLGAIEFFSVIGKTPGWLWLLLAGVVGVLIASLAVSFILPDDSLERVRWSVGQLLFGVALVVAAHVWAIWQVPALEVRGRSHGKYSLVALWRAAASRMPETLWPVNLLSWGASLIVCAFLVVGGFGWWVMNEQVVPDHGKAVQQDK